MVPVLVVVSVFFVYAQKRQIDRALYLYYIMTAVLCMVLLWYRSRVLADSSLGAIDGMGWISHILLAFKVSLDFNRSICVSAVCMALWGVCLLVMLFGWIVSYRVMKSGLAVLWLVCALTSSVSGLILARSNLLLLPITFVAFFVVALLSALSSIKPVWRFIAIGVVVCGILGGGYASRATAQAFHLRVSWRSSGIATLSMAHLPQVRQFHQSAAQP